MEIKIYGAFVEELSGAPDALVDFHTVEDLVDVLAAERGEVVVPRRLHRAAGRLRAERRLARGRALGELHHVLAHDLARVVEEEGVRAVRDARARAAPDEEDGLGVALLDVNLGRGEAREVGQRSE